MKTLLTLIAILVFAGSASADILIGGPDQDTTDAVTVTGDSAGGTWTNPPPSATADGSGLNASLQHDSNYENMSGANGGGWITANSAIRKGWAWWKYEFDAVYPLTTMWVWNGNQNAKTERGVRWNSIYYSTDQVTWTDLGDFEFPEATGTSDYAGFMAADFGGVDAKYVVITAEPTDTNIATNGRGNWGGQARYMLSEVNFFYVPEPTTIALLGLGGGLVLLRRKRSY
jgi:hypothetical protein